MDLAIRIGSHGEGSLISKTLMSNRVLFCASPGYLERNGDPKNPNELTKHPLLFLDHHRSRRFVNSKLLLGDFADYRVVHCNEGSMLTELILAGAGVGVRSWWDIQDFVKAGKLEVILKKHPLDSSEDVKLLFH